MTDRRQRSSSFHNVDDRNMRGKFQEHDKHKRPSESVERRHHNEERRRSDRRGYASGSYSTQSSTAGRTDRSHNTESSARSSFGRGRESSYRGKDRSSSWNDDYVDKSRGDWKCQECRTWNNKKDEYCRRCDTHFRWRDRDGRRSESSGRRSMSDADYSRSHRDRPRDNPRSRRDDDREYYGPNKRSRKSEKDRWPPPFDASDSCYIFDSRSGFFYESETNFFYDPKTKLYYGNNQKKYFQYVPDGKPPYREVSQEQRQVVLEGEDENDGKNPSGEIILDKDDGAMDLAKNNDKKKIAICLKTKPGTFSSEIPTPTAEHHSVLRNKESEEKVNPKKSTQIKQHNADIEKWSLRVKEINEDSAEQESIKFNPSGNSSTNHDAKNSKVIMTAKGKPVCMLCRRKFATVEKLKQHEELSDLHKQNLEKKRKRETMKNGNNELQNAAYRDRAKERRTLYGSDKPAESVNQEKSVVIGPSLTKARTVASTEIVNPDEILGDKNVGNKLLQKLGWKQGSLGRNPNEKNDSTNSQSSVSEKLKQDWERIESIAGSNRHSM